MGMRVPPIITADERRVTEKTKKRNTRSSQRKRKSYGRKAHSKLQSLRADAATVDDPNGDSFLYEAVG